MMITKTSILTGKTTSREIDITEEQLKRHENGELIQNIVPDLSVDDREFLISGITPEEWEEMMRDEEPADPCYE